MSYDLKPGLSKLGKNLISTVTDPEKQGLMKVKNIIPYEDLQEPLLRQGLNAAAQASGVTKVLEEMNVGILGKIETLTDTFNKLNTNVMRVMNYKALQITRYEQLTKGGGMDFSGTGGQHENSQADKIRK